MSRLTSLTVALVLMVLGLGSDSANAQSSANRQAGGSAAAVVGTTLRIERVGAPVLLADGRVEQRYRIVSNVPFVAKAADAAELRWWVGGREVSNDVFVGGRGYHEDVRVTSSGDVDVVVVPATSANSAQSAR